MTATKPTMTTRTGGQVRLWPWLAGLALISSVLSFLIMLVPMPISIALIIVAGVVAVLETRAGRKRFARM
jgi:hypothetical protein